MKDWLWYQKERIAEKLYKFMLWRTVKRLHWSCILWDIRGLPRCEKHGFSAQSWITGKCRKCDEEERTLESGIVVK